MSAFDDEFGLFGEETEESERRATLGARTIKSETAIDEFEPEDAPAPRRRTSAPPRRRESVSRPPSDPLAAQMRSRDVLEFLAKKLVTASDDVTCEIFADEDGKPVIELIVDPEDLGKVIGRSGRVAQALRTIVRATAESRVSVDILDTEEAAEGFEESNEA
jgi:predicted RNA-binding protein YlqC (UPF0109 family)